MKIIFFGSSEFSIPALKACLDLSKDSLAVITTPDKRQGRGLKILPNPVKVFAQQSSLPCEAPSSLKDPALIEKISADKPDFFVVSSYGKFIPGSWLKIPSQLCLNVHPSLLPKYRGAAPIAWSILNGDRETGISIIEVTDKLDAGDIFYQEPMVLPEKMTADELSGILAQRSYDALLNVFKKIREGNLQRFPQDDAVSTYAPKLRKEDGRIDWNQRADQIHNRIRGLVPWPTAYTVFEKGETVQILKARVGNEKMTEKKPGEILSISKQDGLEVQTSRGSLWAERVKPSGKKEMSGSEFANGRHLEPGFILGL